MSYKILTKRNSFLERSITFEVNGEIKSVSAPSNNATFDDLLKQIETQFGDGKHLLESIEQEPVINKITTRTRKKSITEQKEI